MGKLPDETPVGEALQSVGIKAANVAKMFRDHGVVNVGVLKLLLDTDIQQITPLGLRPTVTQLVESLAGDSGAATVGAPRIKQASSGWGGYGQFTAEGATMAEPSAYVLKLRGLPFRVNDSSMAEWFQWAKVDIISGSLVMELNEDGKKSGTGFVLVATKEAQLQSTKELHEQQMEGRTIKVWSSTRHEYEKAGGKFEEAAAGKGGSGGGGKGFPLKLRGAPFKATRRDVVKFFEWSEIQVDPDTIHIELNAEQRKTGNIFLLVKNKEEQEKACAELDKQPLVDGNDRTVFVQKVAYAMYESLSDPTRAEKLKGDSHPNSIKCKQRTQARRDRNFDLADSIRRELEGQGIKVIDDANMWKAADGTTGYWGPETPDAAEGEEAEAAPAAATDSAPINTDDIQW